MNFDKIKNIAEMIGIKVENMTIYKAELIHMRNDGLTSRKIAEILGANEGMVQNWFDKNSQPKNKFIAILEEKYFEREKIIIEELRSPIIKKSNLHSKSHH